MTYCSQIMHEKEEKIKTLEKEIQQLKKENLKLQLSQQNYNSLVDLLDKQAGLHIKTLKQVEAAKTIWQNWNNGTILSTDAMKMLNQILGETTK